MATPPKAPKLKALAKNPKVALTIDDNAFPHKVLLVRGTARLDSVAERYFGSEQGRAWMQQVRTMMPSMMKITITPEWVLGQNLESTGVSVCIQHAPVS